MIPGMMFGGANPQGPLFVGSSASDDNGSGTLVGTASILTGGFASAPKDGDLIIHCAATCRDTAITLNTESGTWAELVNLTVTDTRGTALCIAYRILSGSDTTASFTVDAIGSSYPSSCVTHVWRNIDQTTPFDVTTTTNSLTDTVLADPPSIIPTTSGAIILAVGAGAHQRGLNTYSQGALSNKVTRNRNSTQNDLCMLMGSREWTSGAYDPAAFAFNSLDDSSYSCIAATMALRPANP